MEKYGVADVRTGQARALLAAEKRLRALAATHEKTAAETSEAARLAQEIAELTAALAQ